MLSEGFSFCFCVYLQSMLGSVLVSEADLISLHFPDTVLHFAPVEGLWQPGLEQVYWHHFSKSICSVWVSLCHILVILPVFQTLRQKKHL